MDAEKTTSNKPMLLATCLVAGIGVGILGHVLMGDGKATAAPSCAVLDDAGLNKLVSTASTAASGTQAEALMALHAQNIIIISSGNDDWITTRAALSKDLTELMTEKPKINFTSEHQDIDCNMAWSVGHVQSEYTDAKTGKVSQYKNRYTMIFRHENQGWKISHLHFSTPRNAMAAPE